jgi:hypothetical protein
MCKAKDCVIRLEYLLCFTKEVIWSLSKEYIDIFFISRFRSARQWSLTSNVSKWNWKGWGIRYWIYMFTHIFFRCFNQVSSNN